MNLEHGVRLPHSTVLYSPIQDDARVGRNLQECEARNAHGDQNSNVGNTVAVNAAHELGGLTVKSETAREIVSLESIRIFRYTDCNTREPLKR